jgi:hypothetical protein
MLGWFPTVSATASALTISDISRLQSPQSVAETEKGGP